MELEICVDTLAAALAADRGGAGRIELCSALSEGGLTPSAGLLEEVMASVAVPVHCMVRPRGGDFCYAAGERAAMERDVAFAKRAGAAGVVLGVLTREGRVDVAGVHALVERARPMRVTFHRAFDVTGDLRQSLEDVIATGADILLTSGGAARLPDAVATVAMLVRAAGARIAVMGGSGVTLENAAALCMATKMPAIHASLRRLPPEDRAGRLLPGSAPAYEVHEQEVRALRAALERPAGGMVE